MRAMMLPALQGYGDGPRVRMAPLHSMRGNMSTLPDVDAVRAWCQVSSDAVPDGMLASVMAAEAANQAKACRVENIYDRPDDLCQAFLRRVARVLAARNVPLGITGGEQGPMRLAMFDAEIERLEGFDRGFWFG